MMIDFQKSFEKITYDETHLMKMSFDLVDVLSFYSFIQVDKRVHFVDYFIPFCYFLNYLNALIDSNFVYFLQ